MFILPRLPLGITEHKDKTENSPSSEEGDIK